MDSNEFSRREFLKRVLALSAAAALPTILTKNTLSAARPKPRIVGPNERVNLAVCGIGNRGGEILREFAKTGEANIVALCDVDMGAPHTEQSLKQFPNVPRFQDFRQMFDKMGDQIDAVSVGVRTSRTSRSVCWRCRSASTSIPRSRWHARSTRSS